MIVINYHIILLIQQQSALVVHAYRYRYMYMCTQKSIVPVLVTLHIISVHTCTLCVYYVTS